MLSPSKTYIALSFYLSSAVVLATACSAEEVAEETTGSTTTSSQSNGSGGAGTGGMGAGGMGVGGSSTGGMGTGGIGPQQSLGTCDDCMDAACSAELAVCDGDCVSIEACLETVCRNISDAGEEGQCQVYCQDQFAAGKQAHLNVVNCTVKNASGCVGCKGYDTDYPACRNTMLAGECKDVAADCEASLDCKAYRACTDSCTSKDSCVACSGNADAFKGRELLQRLEFCIAKECINESWEVL